MIGNNLAAVRRALGETPDQLATAVSLKRPEVSSWDPPELPVRFADGTKKVGKRVTVAQLASIVAEVAPLVAKDTGWPVDAAKVKVELLEAGPFWERATKEAAGRLGLTEAEMKWSDPDWGDRIRGKISAFGMSNAAIAVYLTSEDTVVYSRPRIDQMTKDALREITYHELVHNGQDINSSACDNRLKEAMAAAVRACIKNGNNIGDDYFDAMDRVTALMTLHEGQAMTLQEIAQKRNFPDSAGKSDVASIFGGLLALVAPSGFSKFMQYITGKEVVSKLHEQNPDLLDVLFDHPCLAEVLFRQRGRVEIPVAKGASDEDKKALRELVVDLVKMDLSRDPTFKIEIIEQ